MLKEVLNYSMDFGEELTRMYYGPDRTFAEQAKQPLYVHPLFEHAVEKQLEYRDVKIGISAEEISILLNEMHAITDELDADVIESDMFNVPVTLSGEGIMMPQATNMVESNSFLIKTMEKGPVIDELGHMQELSGVFYGFGVRLESIEDEGTIVGLRPVIVYQVMVGSFRSPHASGNIYATGDVGHTQLEFAKDVESRRIDEVLAILTEHDDERVVRAVNSINVALAKKDTPDTPLLKHVGYKIDEVLRYGVDQLYIDAIIDLVSCYLDWGKQYDVSTNTVYKLPRVNQKVNQPLELIERDNPPITFRGRIQQLVVIRNHVNHNGVLIQTEDRSVYAATNTDDASWYIKLTDLKYFDSP